MVPLTPNKNNGVWPTWTPPLIVTFRDYVTDVGYRVSAKFFGLTVINQILLIMDFLTSWIVSKNVVNKTGSTIPAFTLVRITGYDSGTGKLTIDLADKDTGAAEFITRDDIEDDAEGTVYRSADGTNLDTSAFSAEGDEVFLGDDGAFAISGSQSVGRVIVKHATAGEIDFYVSQASSTNELKVVTPSGAVITETYAEEEITLAAATHTDSTADLLQAGANIENVCGIDLDGLGHNIDVGDSDVTDRYISAFTSGGVNSPFDSWNRAVPAGNILQGSTAGKVRITHNAGDVGKRVKVTVFFKKVTPPTA